MRVDHPHGTWGLGVWICAPNKLYGWSLCVTVGPWWLQFGNTKRHHTESIL